MAAVCVGGVFVTVIARTAATAVVGIVVAVGVSGGGGAAAAVAVKFHLKWTLRIFNDSHKSTTRTPNTLKCISFEIFLAFFSRNLFFFFC